MLLNLYMVYSDRTVLFITANTFHTVIADFVRIQVAAVAFAAADAFPVIQNAHPVQGHPSFLLDSTGVIIHPTRKEGQAFGHSAQTTHRAGISLLLSKICIGSDHGTVSFCV